jgi:hypothetical protein
LRNRLPAPAGVPLIIGQTRLAQPGIQRGKVGHLGHGHQMRAAKPSAAVFHATFLMCAGNPRLTKLRGEQIVRP